MAKRHSIAIFTGSRAEYGLLYPTIKHIVADPDLSLQLIVSGTHLSSAHGATASEITRDGFNPALEIPLAMQGDGEGDIAHAVAVILEKMTAYFAQHKPDTLIILGDRFEVLAAAQAALFSRIPIVHLHGGEATEGLIDEAIRHAVTKMAHLHFVAAEPYRQRVIQMGEQPDRVVVMGATCIDNIRDFTPLPKPEFFAQVKLDADKPFFLVTHHPLTLVKGAAKTEIEQLLAALESFPHHQLLFTGVNADMENAVIRDAIAAYCEKRPNDTRMVQSLGRVLYYNAMHYSDMVIGNSSSGLLEAPFFGKPTINIGKRQQGRISGESVIHVEAEKQVLAAAIQKGLSSNFRAIAERGMSPYGQLSQSPSVTIVDGMKRFLQNGTIVKSFYTIPV
ncbi:MAG: UDP-N-acetylglucosamine 2-epimerase [Rickettsiales bacterium]|nr:UDP-N-acetylglucosamine 2-epimerase [Rickettsiales bacterium]